MDLGLTLARSGVGTGGGGGSALMFALENLRENFLRRVMVVIGLSPMLLSDDQRQNVVKTSVKVIAGVKKECRRSIRDRVVQEEEIPARHDTGQR